MCCDGNDAKTWDNLIMLLIKLIIAASENHQDIMDLKWLFQDNLH